MNGSFIPAKDGYWLVIQNSSRVSLFCFCSHELLPSFSHILIILSSNRYPWLQLVYWQSVRYQRALAVASSLLFSINGRPKNDDLCSRDKGSGLLMSTAKLAEGLFDGTRRSGTVSCRDWSFHRAEALQTTVTPWLEHSDRMLKACSDSLKMCQNPFAKLTTSLTPVSDEKVLCYSIKYCCGDRQEHETEEDHASMC